MRATVARFAWDRWIRDFAGSRAAPSRSRGEVFLPGIQAGSGSPSGACGRVSKPFSVHGAVGDQRLAPRRPAPRPRGCLRRGADGDREKSGRSRTLAHGRAVSRAAPAPRACGRGEGRLGSATRAKRGARVAGRTAELVGEGVGGRGRMRPASVPYWNESERGAPPPPPPPPERGCRGAGRAAGRPALPGSAGRRARERRERKRRPARASAKKERKKTERAGVRANGESEQARARKLPSGKKAGRPAGPSRAAA